MKIRFHYTKKKLKNSKTQNSHPAAGRAHSFRPEDGAFGDSVPSDSLLLRLAAAAATATAAGADFRAGGGGGGRCGVGCPCEGGGGSRSGASGRVPFPSPSANEEEISNGIAEIDGSGGGCV